MKNKKHDLKRSITFEDYENCLESKIALHRDMVNLRSVNQTMYTIKRRKIALSTGDDKRVTLEDGENTLPYGHFSLE